MLEGCDVGSWAGLVNGKSRAATRVRTWSAQVKFLRAMWRAAKLMIVPSLKA
jgi:hypothetical protein